MVIWKHFKGKSTEFLCNDFAEYSMKLREISAKLPVMYKIKGDFNKITEIIWILGDFWNIGTFDLSGLPLSWIIGRSRRPCHTVIFYKLRSLFYVPIN